MWLDELLSKTQLLKISWSKSSSGWSHGCLTVSKGWLRDTSVCWYRNKYRWFTSAHTWEFSTMSVEAWGLLHRGVTCMKSRKSKVWMMPFSTFTWSPCLKKVFEYKNTIPVGQDGTTGATSAALWEWEGLQTTLQVFFTYYYLFYQLIARSLFDRKPVLFSHLSCLCAP